MDQPDYSYLSDPAEREWLTNVVPADVLFNAHRIYDFMAEAGLPAESVVRELAFTKASDALGLSYEVFYQAWLSGRSTEEKDSEFQSQAARDAQASNYGSQRYWEVLDAHSMESRDYYLRHGKPERAAEMMTRSLSQALMGNDGI